MAQYVIDSTTLDGIADSIRTKTGKTDKIATPNFATEIKSINATKINVVCSEEPPTDTSVLWVKGNELSGVVASPQEVDTERKLTNNIATLPAAMRGIAVGVVGTKAYLFGGAKGSTHYNTIYTFDTETKSLEKISVTLPTVAFGIGAGVVGTKIYLFGGNSSGSLLNTINVFDTETNEIMTLSTTLPISASHIATAVVGTKIYLFGGVQGSTYYRTIYVFDTETRALTELSAILPYLSGAYSISTGVVGTKIYLLGGYGRYKHNEVCIFNTVTNSLTNLGGVLPYRTGGMASGTVGTKIYLFGGYDGGALNAIIMFDTKTNTAEKLPETLPTATDAIMAGTVGADIYLFGGNGLDTINLFSVGHALTPNRVQIQTALDKNIFTLQKTDTIQVDTGVEAVYLGNEDGVAETVDAYLYDATAGEWVNVANKGVTLAAGTYEAQYVLSVPESSEVSAAIKFISNGVSYNEMSTNGFDVYYGATPVYDDEQGWYDTAHQTIKLDTDQTVSVEFGEWYNANFAKQS